MAASARGADLGTHGPADARHLRASARGHHGSLRFRGTTWVGPHRSGGARAGFPWHPGDMRRRFCMLALFVGAFAPAAGASAASPPGTLAQLAGAGGCASAQAGLGCTGARGLDDARAVALSPDGLSLYVAAATPASVTSFGVAPGNGLLQQLNLGAGCLSSIAQEGCAAARALEGASAIVVSPDNLHVYVASATAASVTSFARQPNGSLVQLAGVAGCISNTPAGGLRHWHLAGRRRRNRDLAGRPLRLRRRQLGRLAARVLARRGHRAPHPARRRGGLHPPEPHRLRSGHRPRRALGDRDRTGRDVALRRLERRHADLVRSAT